MQKAKEAKAKSGNRGSKASASGGSEGGPIGDLKSHLRTVTVSKASSTPLSKQIKVQTKSLVLACSVKYLCHHREECLLPHWMMSILRQSHIRESLS